MNLGEFVRKQHEAGNLVVQPRMGLSDPAQMRAGLIATRMADASTVGTVTLDSYTRLGQLESVGQAVRQGLPLNGYPIVSYAEATTREMLDGVVAPDFPVQVRHGSARPMDIFRAITGVRLHATEGGPISYCLPYGRTPLDESVRNWAICCELVLKTREFGVEPHLETFGGCMLGQLCPPSQLVAISVIEALFFYRRGLRSLSVSYAQQTNAEQDREAVAALRRLCAELLPGADLHVVIYAYMGLFPETPEGARGVLADAARLAVNTGSERLIVKTVAEAHRIPTVAENVAALEHAAAVARATSAPVLLGADGGQTYLEAYALVDAVLNCDPDLGNAIVAAFKRGLLDVPYCLHPDNAGRARSYIDAEGKLRWAETGSLPLSLSDVTDRRGRRSLTSANLLDALSYVRNRFDAIALERGRAFVLDAAEAVAAAGEGELD